MDRGDSVDESVFLGKIAKSSGAVLKFLNDNPESRVAFVENVDAETIALEFSQKFPAGVTKVLHAVIDSKGSDYIGIAERPILHVFIEPDSLRFLGFRKFLPHR